MSKCLLVVDDNAAIRHLVRRHMEAVLGFQVREAVDGLEGIQRSREGPLDLIVLDLAMPRMNGLDAAAILRQEFPKIPIILFTLHKNSVTERQAEALGIRAVISKTDHMEVLGREVQRLTKSAPSAPA